jgi:hypothetical protein
LFKISRFRYWHPCFVFESIRAPISAQRAALMT